MEELKISRIEAEQQLNQFVGNLKVEGMSADARLALVKLKLELTKLIKENDEFRETTRESIEKPDNYDELEKASNADNATQEDKDAFKAVQEEYNKKLVEVLYPYLSAEVTLPFDYISEEDFYELVKHNDVNIVYGYEYIYNKLVEKDGSITNE